MISLIVRFIVTVLIFLKGCYEYRSSKQHEDSNDTHVAHIFFMVAGVIGIISFSLSKNFCYSLFEDKLKCPIFIIRKFL